MRKALLYELAFATVGLVGTAHLLYRLRFIPWIDASLATIVAILFLYLPTIVLWRKRRSIDFLDRSVRDALRSFVVFVVVAVIVFTPFFYLARFWQEGIFGLPSFRMAEYPRFWSVTLFQILMVALPEEFYFRGYFQSTVDRCFEKRWNILGVKLGWGWILTALVFAFAHSIVVVRWWHFAIFFPALLFGYLRERTGSITAPILFHAASNVFMDWFVRGYV
ncbi:MAG: CPBP family intramembrane metalloprotease [Deltaproteobacteria bacterium]|nr:CPBP family intramembrane metalloprotease [Deltaproteobacteria bacterium]